MDPDEPRADGQAVGCANRFDVQIRAGRKAHGRACSWNAARWLPDIPFVGGLSSVGPVPPCRPSVRPCGRQKGGIGA